MKSGRGRKICKACGKVTGPRMKICSCGYQFQFKQPYAAAAKSKGSRLNKDIKVSKVKRKTTKLCPTCTRVIAIQAMICPTCGFVFQKKVPNNLIVEWESLEKGTIIKVVGGGPYSIGKDSEGNKIRIDMSDLGIYQIASISKTGISGYNLDTTGGHSFLYMGDPYQSKETAIYHHPHQLVLIKPKNLKT